MFAESFFHTLHVWRQHPTATPVTSTWHGAPDGVRRQFVLARVPAPRRDPANVVRARAPRRAMPPTVPMTFRAA